MARPTKTEARADARRELIDAAWQLFSSVGYDATPVSAIIDRVGLSKGAFYYYFESKEDILDAVVGYIIDEMAREVEPVPSMPSLSPIEKLNLFLETISSWKLANIAILREAVEVIFRDENIIIRHKMNRLSVERFSPILAEIIGQGIEAGVFDVDYPEETAEMIMHFTSAMSEMQMPAFIRLGEDPQALELVTRRAGLYLGGMERILGAPAGSVFSVDRDMVKRFEQAIRDRGVNGNAG